MAAFRTGDTLVWIIGPVQDDSGAAITSAAWSAVVARKPDGTTFSPTYSEIGSGVYKATVVSTARGNWFLYSQATVNAVVYSDAASITVDDGFALASDWTSARAAKLDSLGAASVTYSGPVASGGDVSVIAGDAYLNADGRALPWSNPAWPDLTMAQSVAFTVVALRTAAVLLTKAVTVIDASHMRVDMTSAETTALGVGGYRFTVVAALADSTPATLVNAGMTVKQGGT